jgi:hypothetical protein
LAHNSVPSASNAKPCRQVIEPIAFAKSESQG